MRRIKYIGCVAVLMFCISSINVALGQSSDTLKRAKADTIELDTSQITTIKINCPVLSGGRGGSDGLLVINSMADVNSYFGYNCDFPDVDFLTKTLLYITTNFVNEVPYKIRTFKGKVIFSAYVCKGYNYKIIVSVLIPKIGRDEGVYLDVNEVDCLAKMKDFLK